MKLKIEQRDGVDFLVEDGWGRPASPHESALWKETQRLRDALQMIADETMVPDAWPEKDWKSWSTDRQLHISALLIAGAALEGTSDSAHDASP